MVQSQPGTGSKMTLAQAGEAYARARREFSEAFLRFKAADPKRTDNTARAMAELESGLAEAEVAWSIAQNRAVMMHEEFQVKYAQFILSGQEQSDANQS